MPRCFKSSQENQIYNSYKGRRSTVTPPRKLFEVTVWSAFALRLVSNCRKQCVITGTPDDSVRNPLFWPTRGRHHCREVCSVSALRLYSLWIIALSEYTISHDFLLCSLMCSEIFPDILVILTPFPSCLLLACYKASMLFWNSPDLCLHLCFLVNLKYSKDT